jgi:thioredoxin-related protein
VLGELADQAYDVKHVELDVTHRADLAARYHVMQTPTTLILDQDGAVRARIGGAVRRDLISAELDRILVAA